MSREGGFDSGVTSKSTIKRLIRRIIVTFKPEIRIPKSETISKSQYQMTKTLHVLALYQGGS